MITLLLAVYLEGPLTVGDGKQFSRIEAAVKAAHSGDQIQVYPKAAGYSETAVKLSTPRVQIVGMGGTHLIVLDGGKYNYTGAGSVPRAIFQFDPGSDGSSLANFELRDAHNDSFNGAGVRINAANNVEIGHNYIHDCDMGIMSNGISGNAAAASGQLIEYCTIDHNGNLSDPGYNHNLYLGGTSVTVQFCNIYSALTGHNLKSRAHFNLVQYCYIHSSANRELDLVEAWDTERANSNAVLIGNVIVKDPNCTGNRETIQFGAESGVHNGKIYLFNNTIVTPFLSGVVALTSSKASAEFINNVIFNAVQNNPDLTDLTHGAVLSNVGGQHNWLSKGYSLTGTMIDNATRWEGSSVSTNPGFVRGDFNIPKQPFQWKPYAPVYLDGFGEQRSGLPAHRYSGAAKWETTSSKFLGAG